MQTSLSDSNIKAIHGLNEIQTVTGLTETGKLGLIQLVNPFADFQMKRTGYYDSCEASSVIKRVSYTKSITVPSSAGTNPWDCHIFTSPFINRSPVAHSGVLIGNVVIDSTTSPNGDNIGGVTVMTAPAGQITDIANCVNSGVVFMDSTGICPFKDPTNNNVVSDVDDIARIIGMGFEVHDVTQDLKRQGTCTVWRQASENQLDREVVTTCTLTSGTTIAPTGLNNTGAHMMRSMVDIPASAAVAIALPGSRQWESRRGCMVIPTLASTDIPPQKLTGCMPVVRQLPGSSSVGSGVSPGTGTWTMGTENVSLFPIAQTLLSSLFVLPPATGQLQVKLDAPMHVANFNCSGAIFTGLDPAAVLQLNTIFYIEIFPGPQSPLVTLGNPSPPYDPMAMQIYSSIMNKLPVGVPVEDNADGDWFFEVVEWASEFVRPALKALPGGNLLTGVADMANKWANNKLIERNLPQPKRQLKKIDFDQELRPTTSGRAREIPAFFKKGGQPPLPGQGQSKKARQRRNRNNRRRAASEPRGRTRTARATR